MPVINDIIRTQYRICYDYSALTAAMLRSLGMFTKLAIGYKSDLEKYHVSNQVNLNSQWITIDTTYNFIYIRYDIPINMGKDGGDYKIEKYISLRKPGL